MANIVITSDANFINIDYNDKPGNGYIQACKIRKSIISSINCFVGEGIGVSHGTPKPYVLISADVDSVDANTDVQTDAKLYAALKNLM